LLSGVFSAATDLRQPGLIPPQTLPAWQTWGDISPVSHGFMVPRRRGIACWRPIQAAEKLVWRVIPRSPPFLLADDEESRIGLKTLRARFLSRACGIGMTACKGLSAA